jgi:glycerol-3-phosphate dehydrogenase (NAD(P)+)
MKVAVIGAGAWGTTLANMLAKKGADTTLWVLEQDLAAEIRKTGRNTWYLKDFPLDERLQVTSDLTQASEEAEVHLMCVPSQFLRSVLERMARFLPKRPAMVCASKGIELSTLSPMSKLFEDAVGALKVRYAHISGPSFAFEVSRELPTSVALGCADKKLAKELQELFSTEYFRVYTTPDYRGVELGGAVKNIIAIAAGIADGLEFGHNARAALINRGLVEMSRFGKAMGANPQTFMGLSGMGDLVLTCTGDLSRNRQVGKRLGQGQKLLDILDKMKMVAEGVKTTEAVHKLAKNMGVELPITEQVHAILYEEKDAATAVRDLMARPLKEES